MESEVEHARQVAQRKGHFRIIGWVSLIVVLFIVKGHDQSNFMLLCIGCAMIQMAYLDYPKPGRPDKFLLISPFETNYPSAHTMLFYGLGLLSIASLIAELWIGIASVGWKFIPVLVGAMRRRGQVLKNKKLISQDLTPSGLL